MSACEKCWSDAFMRAHLRGSHQADEYGKLLKERKDKPCTPEQQAGGES